MKFNLRRKHSNLDGDDKRLSELVSRASGPDQSLSGLVAAVWDQACTIEMTSDAIYGPAHWPGAKQFHSSGFPYYKFLAAFVSSQKCEHICEIGTHYGGSAFAMRHGGAKQILTVDVSDLNTKLHETPEITKLTGDANSAGILKTVIGFFGGLPIDLLYIDADHRFLPTITNVGLYCLLLRPRFVIMDDIVLNPEMRDVWNALRLCHGNDAINCADVTPEIRDIAVGFGLLRCRKRSLT